MIRDISIDHRLQQTVQPPLRAVLPSWPTFRVDPLKCGGVVALESLPWSVVGCDVSCQWSHNLDLDLDRASTSGAHMGPIQRAGTSPGAGWPTGYPTQSSLSGTSQCPVLVNFLIRHERSPLVGGSRVRPDWSTQIDWN